MGVCMCAVDVLQHLVRWSSRCDLGAEFVTAWSCDQW